MVARFDYDRACVVARWPLREMLIAYVEAARAQASEIYRHEVLLWQVRHAFGGSKSDKPPKVPSILEQKR